MLLDKLPHFFDSQGFPCSLLKYSSNGMKFIGINVDGIWIVHPDPRGCAAKPERGDAHEHEIDQPSALRHLLPHTMSCQNVCYQREDPKWVSFLLGIDLGVGLHTHNTSPLGK